MDAWAPAIVSVTVGTRSATLDRDGDQIPDVIEYSLGLSTGFPDFRRRENSVFKGDQRHELSHLAGPARTLARRLHSGHRIQLGSHELGARHAALQHAVPVGSPRSESRHRRETLRPHPRRALKSWIACSLLAGRGWRGGKMVAR